MVWLCMSSQPVVSKTIVGLLDVFEEQIYYFGRHNVGRNATEEYFFEKFHIPVFLGVYMAPMLK